MNTVTSFYINKSGRQRPAGCGRFSSTGRLGTSSCLLPDDIKTEQSVPTSDFINVNVDAVAKVRISPQAEGIKLAAKNFLP